MNVRSNEHRRWSRAFLPIFSVVVAGTVGGLPAGAQRTSSRSDAGVVARTFELRPRDGFERQLDDGYRRHLDWHVVAGERWPWYLWQVTNGERAGLYVDGTFGHAWSAFDHAVNPSGDAGDNALNVDPYATRAANHVWRFRPELSGAPVDLEIAPLVMRTEYRARPDARAAFDNALRELRTVGDDRPFAIFELVSGGDLGTYIVWIPAATWVDGGAMADRWASVMRSLAAAAERARAEIWRFRPELSLCRSAAAQCHGTLR